MFCRWSITAAVLALCARPVSAQLTIDAFAGTAFNLHTPLTISQRGQPDIRFTAHYDTKPLEDTPYFGGRVAIWKNNKAWVVTLVHHKLYLENPPSGVQWFRVTYGFNMATLGRGWRHGNLSYTAGAGVVVTHASNSVRGKRYLGTGGPLNKGYTFSGVTAIGSAQYKLPLTHFLYLSAETMVSASYIEVNVNDGNAAVPQAALHLHAGFGYAF